MDAVVVMYIATGIVVLLGLAGVYANRSLGAEVPKPKAKSEEVEILFFLEEDDEDEETGIFVRIPTTEEGWKNLRKKEGVS